MRSIGVGGNVGQEPVQVEAGEGVHRRCDISPKSSLLRRKSQGGPQPVEIERMLIERRKELEEHMDMLDGRRSAVEAAKGLLRETVEYYLSK